MEIVRIEEVIIKVCRRNLMVRLVIGEETCVCMRNCLGEQRVLIMLIYPAAASKSASDSSTYGMSHRAPRLPFRDYQLWKGQKRTRICAN